MRMAFSQQTTNLNPETITNNQPPNNWNYLWRLVCCLCVSSVDYKHKTAKFYFWSNAKTIFRISVFLAPSRSPMSHSVRLSVCLSVCLSGTSLSRALNLHLALIGQSQVSLRSFSGHSQVILRSFSGHSQVILSSVSGWSLVSAKSSVNLSSV